nr:MAG TPA: hypothetical protein [Caudoviricetes sp.]
MILPRFWAQKSPDFSGPPAYRGFGFRSKKRAQMAAFRGFCGIGAVVFQSAGPKFHGIS